VPAQIYSHQRRLCAQRLRGARQISPTHALARYPVACHASIVKHHPQQTILAGHADCLLDSLAVG
jgi:hypothetical protein